MIRSLVSRSWAIGLAGRLHSRGASSMIATSYFHPSSMPAMTHLPSSVWPAIAIREFGYRRGSRSHARRQKRERQERLKQMAFNKSEEKMQMHRDNITRLKNEINGVYPIIEERMEKGPELWDSLKTLHLASATEYLKKWIFSKVMVEEVVNKGNPSWKPEDTNLIIQNKQLENKPRIDEFAKEREEIGHKIKRRYIDELRGYEMIQVLDQKIDELKQQPVLAALSNQAQKEYIELLLRIRTSTSDYTHKVKGQSMLPTISEADNLLKLHLTRSMVQRAKKGQVSIKLCHTSSLDFLLSYMHNTFIDSFFYSCTKAGT